CGRYARSADVLDGWVVSRLATHRVQTDIRSQRPRALVREAAARDHGRAPESSRQRARSRREFPVRWAAGHEEHELQPFGHRLLRATEFRTIALCLRAARSSARWTTILLRHRADGWFRFQPPADHPGAGRSDELPVAGPGPTACSRRSSPETGSDARPGHTRRTRSDYSRRPDQEMDRALYRQLLAGGRNPVHLFRTGDFESALDRRIR